MNDIKLIALDLDDTLLRSDLTISFRTRAAVKKAARRGIAIVINTGRLLSGIEKYLRILGLNKRKGYAACGNGTIIYESDSGKAVYESKLETETALNAFNLIDAEGFPVLVFEHNTTYVSFHNEFSSIDEKLTGTRQIVPPDFRELLRKGTYKLVVPAEPQLINNLETLIGGLMGDKITLFTSKPYYLEILPPGANKGTSLARIAALLGIERERVMAFGDSMNDEAMLRWAGCSVAMLNGDARVKAVARMVSARTNDDDGVADIIERYVFKQEPLPPRP